MAVASSHVTVGTTAVDLTGTDTDLRLGQSIAVTNKGSGVVYLGGPGVTTGTGFEVPVDGCLAVDLSQGEKLFAVAGADQLVQILWVGV